MAAHGGHLGSNLGVVELTLALHRVFDSPRDVLLWDTGHQAYVHKIVTGRQEGFGRLRQAGGLSGYPCRAESEHDWVENSHASTILSYAHGLAVALRLHGERARRVVAVVGDGSMTGGMAYEALNNLGHSQSRVLIVLNDNGRSYAPTVGRLASGLTRLRLSPTYVKRRDWFQRAVRGVPKIGEYLDRGVDGVRAAAREVVVSPAGFFEDLGIRYVGPVDGHDLARMERILALAAEHDGPIVVHVLTQKGRGYGPAEADRERCLHDAPGFDVATGPPPWAPGGFTEVFARAMVELGERRPDLVAITAAMAGPTGLCPFQERWPERVVDVGIAEQHAVTAAAGMAMGGLRPVVAVYSTFLARAIDQVNLDVGLHRLPVVFCIDRAGVTGDDGPSHHGVLDLALLLQVPGLTILAPSTAEELRAMLDHAVTLDGPAAIRYPKGLAPAAPHGRVGIGCQARRIRRGSAVCLLAVGKDGGSGRGGGPHPRRRRDHLPRCGTSVRSSLSTRRCSTTPLATGWWSRSRTVCGGEEPVRPSPSPCRERALAAGLPCPPVLVLGVPDAYIPHGQPDRILAALGLDGPGIAGSVLAALPGRACGGAPVTEQMVVALDDDLDPLSAVARSVAHTAPGRPAPGGVAPGGGPLGPVADPAPGGLQADVRRPLGEHLLHPPRARGGSGRRRRPAGLPGGRAGGVATCYPAGSFVYRARDEASGLVEWEHDQVFVAIADTSDAAADPAEIDEVACLPYADAIPAGDVPPPAPRGRPRSCAGRFVALDGRWTRR